MKLFEKKIIEKVAENKVIGGISDTGTTSHYQTTYTKGCPGGGPCEDSPNDDIAGDWDDRDACER
jgi:hypothetical protein